MCLIADSKYLVGLENENMIALWDEQTDQHLLRISGDLAWSIKRVLASNAFLLKTQRDGLKLMTFENLARNQHSLKQFHGTKEVWGNPADSLQV